MGTMQLQAPKQRSWKIKIDARDKANKFQFKFKATQFNSTWKLLNFSLFLRIHHFFLLLQSDAAPTHQKTTLKSKFLKFFRKFTTRRTEKRSIAAEKNSTIQYPESKVSADPFSKCIKEKPVCTGSSYFGNVALLWLFLKNLVGVKARTSMVVVLTVAVAAIVCLEKYIYDGTKDHVVQLVCKAWKYAAASL